MPLYAFECGVCGTFEERRPLAESSSPSRCPVCMGPGRRLYTPPGLVRTPAHVRQARHLEEKSAHEPEVVQGLPSGLPGRPLRAPAHATPTWAAPRRGGADTPLSRL
jgi:putative FmdB family regulatory protein